MREVEGQSISIVYVMLFGQRLQDEDMRIAWLILQCRGVRFLRLSIGQFSVIDGLVVVAATSAQPHARPPPAALITILHVLPIIVFLTRDSQS